MPNSISQHRHNNPTGPLLISLPLVGSGARDGRTPQWNTQKQVSH